MIAASDADIILQELVGSSSAARSLVENKINKGINAKNLAERTHAADGLTQDLRDLIWSLAGTNKEFHFVDVANDRPEYQQVLKARELKSKDSPSSEEEFYISILQRNACVATQVLEYAKLYPEKSILAVLGALHSDVAKMFVGGTVEYMSEKIKDASSKRLAKLALYYPQL
jgi:hypothetical protein